MYIDKIDVKKYQRILEDDANGVQVGDIEQFIVLKMSKI